MVGTRHQARIVTDPDTRYHSLGDTEKDTLLSLILALGAEVWVLADRMALLESVLDEHDLEVSDSIEQMAATDAWAPQAAARRDEFLARFLRAVDDPV